MPGQQPRRQGSIDRHRPAVDEGGRSSPQERAAAHPPAGAANPNEPGRRRRSRPSGPNGPAADAPRRAKRRPEPRRGGGRGEPGRRASAQRATRSGARATAREPAASGERAAAQAAGEPPRTAAREGAGRGARDAAAAHPGGHPPGARSAGGQAAIARARERGTKRTAAKPGEARPGRGRSSRQAAQPGGTGGADGAAKHRRRTAAPERGQGASGTGGARPPKRAAPGARPAEVRAQRAPLRVRIGWLNGGVTPIGAVVGVYLSISCWIAWRT